MDTKNCNATWAIVALLLCAATPASAGDISARGEMTNARAWVSPMAPTATCRDCVAVVPHKQTLTATPQWSRNRPLLQPAGVGLRAARQGVLRNEPRLLAANTRFDTPAATAARYAGLR